MRYQFGIQDKVVCLNIKDKVILYAYVIHIRTYQKMGGVPLQIQTCLNNRCLRSDLVNGFM